MATKRWESIPQFPRAHYEITAMWRKDLERHIAHQIGYGLDLEPDFQRAHVWTDAQRVAYLEYALMGGEVGKVLTFVCQDWDLCPVPGYAILDGKQRLESVRRFLRGEIRVFPDADQPDGYTYQDIDRIRDATCFFYWRVVVCPTRADVLRLYLNINAGGTPHGPEELDRVRAMLAREQG